MTDGPNPELRDLLFADLPPGRAREVYQRGGDATSPLVELADAAIAGDPATARAALDRVAPGDRESRLRAQAWSLARTAGVMPQAGEASQVLGVVVDMGLEEGLDTLAAFADGSARYLNHSGPAIVWEVPDPAVGQRVHALLAAAATVLGMTAPLEGPRPGPPGIGGAMISVLTPAGLHVGAGSIHALSRDSIGGPVISTAAELLGLLVQRATAGRAGRSRTGSRLAAVAPHALGVGGGSRPARQSGHHHRTIGSGVPQLALEGPRDGRQDVSAVHRRQLGRRGVG